MNLDQLPEDCIAQVLSLTSPQDACRSSVLSSSIREAAESDTVWEKFLPSDYREIISRMVSPTSFSSKKEEYLNLSLPLLIDGGSRTFSIDKETNKKCYMLSARELSITWSSNPLYWCWKPFLGSRFSEVAELVIVSWLEVRGSINTKMLSPNTIYGAYLVVKFAERAFGLASLPSEVSVEVGNQKSHGIIYLRQDECWRKTSLERIFILNRTEALRSRVFEGEERVVRERKRREENGWLEIELGQFYNDGNGSDNEVRMSLREVKGEHLKGGLVVEGIEIRPKK